MAVVYVLYAMKLKLWLRSNPVSKCFFIIQLGHRPGLTNVVPSGTRSPTRAM